ncbi:MAG: hypothetical protein ABW110_13825 [Steroidobacteraceae bacterium]
MRIRCFSVVLCIALSSSPGAIFAADAESEVAALEAQCEAAREAKLKPLRDAEIDKCKNEQGKDPGYCERYWSDYGNAVKLPNGNYRPRLFDDLPECVRAFEARKKLNREGK